MDGQERLFRLAVESGVVHFEHKAGVGWQLSVRLRRGQELWREAQVECYSGLTTVELLDTISATLDTSL